MTVLINFKICDNSPFCDGIAACPTGALYFDQAKKRISIDKTKCIECGKCACCSVGAIHYVETEEEAHKIRKEIQDDTRTEKDLFVNRYGATILPDVCVIKEESFEEDVLKYPHLRILEVITEDSIYCLLKSVPVKTLLMGNNEWHYRKMLVKNIDIIRKYKVRQFPALLFFNNGKFVGKIEGYYDVSNVDELHSKISKISSKVNIYGE